MKWLFWASVAMLAYTYFGYAGWLWLRRRYRPRPVRVASFTPFVSIVMIVRNEAAVLERKLRNLLTLNYPPVLSEIIVVSDGSTDATNDILGQHSADSRVRIIFGSEPHGKAAGLNEAIGIARGEIVVFTDARQMRIGRFEQANGSTIFLDEIGDLPLELQPKLLRVLQEREFERLGGTRPIRLNVRLVAATNRSLPEAVKGGTFRNDLYYRLNVVSLQMPPLRERREDISVLADYFLTKAGRKCRSRVKPLSPETLACLMHYDWPGNVRELENALERALVLGSTDSILPDDLPEAVLEVASTTTASSDKYHGSIKETKKQLILQALQQANGNYIEAAKTLGMHPNSLLRLIRNLDLKGVKAGMQGE
jgi:hypothetical protein